LQGSLWQQGYVARFEHDLDVRGDFVPFKETYLRVNGSTWEKDREALATAPQGRLRQGLLDAFQCVGDRSLPSHAASSRRLPRLDREFRVDRERLHRKQRRGFRLNFFVDEVGQFIGQDSKLMLNLQTVAETLGTICNGKAWVFVTSQADLEGVLGTFKGLAAQDITKIMGRFKTQLTLASADVREVIQKRLLAKKEESLKSSPKSTTARRTTSRRFTASAISPSTCTAGAVSDEFCGFYPFTPISSTCSSSRSSNSPRTEFSLENTFP